MWEFWTAVAALSLVAVAFVLYPAYRRPRGGGTRLREALRAGYRMRREELQRDVEAGWLDARLFVEAEEELDRGMLADTDARESPALEDIPGSARRTAWLLGVATVVVALALLPVSSPLVRAVLVVEFGEGPASRLADLREQARQTPANVEVWKELGRLHQDRDETGPALDAWRRANELSEGQDTEVLVRLADALARHGGDRFPDDAIAHLEAALVLDPNHPGALWLSGLAAVQNDRPVVAEEYWMRLLAALPEEDAETRVLVEGWIDGLRAGSEEIVGPSLAVRVTLSADLAVTTELGKTLFVYARRLTGPPMPLVIWRGVDPGLPVEVLLDDRLALVPGAGLAQEREVMVVARLSASGQAQLQPGDITGESGPVTLEDSVAVTVVLDRVEP